MTWPRQSALVGVGESALGKVPNRSSHSLQAEAALAALADAGLTKDDVDGLITMPSYTERRNRHALSLAQYLGLSSDRVRWVSSTMHGSVAASGVAVHEACMAVAAGVCDCVLVVSGDNLLSPGSDAALTLLSDLRDGEFETPYGTFIAATFALTASRYMVDCDVTEEDLARVAVALRERANDHPNAQLRDKIITVEDVLASPVVSSPLRRLNCAIVSDGGCAVVVKALDRLDPGPDRIVVAAGETAYGPPGGQISDDLGQVESRYSIREGAKAASERALGVAGVSLDDVDILMTYDPFSFVPLLFFEGLGYCKPGEGGHLVREGFLDDGPGRNWNLHGGLHAYCHPGNAGGLFMFIEAVRQLRGAPLGRPATGRKVCLIQGYGANKGVFPSTVLTRG